VSYIFPSCPKWGYSSMYFGLFGTGLKQMKRMIILTL
jgi:hypothetical protein